jgi:alpha-D-ribose 1-methylphosphonate 5-triphosphate synthase subunit PhnH
MPALEYFRIGRYEYFENATTILVQVDDIFPVVEYKRSGIWVDEIFQLELKGVPRHFWHQWRYLSGMHPLGIDIFFTCEDVLTVLPKTSSIEN